MNEKGKLTDLTIQKIKSANCLAEADQALVWYLNQIGRTEIADAYIDKFNSLDIIITN